MDASPVTPNVMILSSDSNWLMDLTAALPGADASTFQNAPSAFAALQWGEPTVLVVAPSDTADALAAPAELRVSPLIAIVLVVREATVSMLRDAMAAGIADVIAADQVADLPHTVEGLFSRVSMASSNPVVADPASLGYVIAVTAPKGGQGTTTVSVNLALSCARQGSVALVEGDPYFGDVLSTLGYGTSAAFEPATDVLPGHWLNDSLIRHTDSGLIVVLPRFEGGRPLTVNEAIDGLSALQQRVDTTIMDIPILGVEEHRLHRAADVVVMVSRDRKRDLDNAALASRVLGLQPEHARLCISNYVDGRTPKHRDLRAHTRLEEIDRIPESDAVERAIGDGVPVVIGAPDDPAAVAFGQMATDVGAMLATFGTASRS